ncbi:MAG: TraB domain-containing protein [Halobacteriales archaeon]|nr:TraB domain-containing protein [Halobacteriales archaeon]
MIETRDGITLIGTAHILQSSVREVEETLRRIRPARVLVELDPARLKALRDPEGWQNTDIFRVLKEKKQHLFLLQLYLAAMQAQMGRETGVSPGADMLRAVPVRAGREDGAHRRA